MPTVAPYDDIADWYESVFPARQRAVQSPDGFADGLGIDQAVGRTARPRHRPMPRGRMRDRIVIRPGYLDGSWTTESWTDQGVPDKVGAATRTVTFPPPCSEEISEKLQFRV